MGPINSLIDYAWTDNGLLFATSKGVSAPTRTPARPHARRGCAPPGQCTLVLVSLAKPPAQGLVYRVDLSQQPPNPQLFLNMTDEVDGGADKGMLGIAVHPNFAVKPWVYLLYTVQPW